MNNPFVLVFDIESVGQTRLNPNVSIGAALVDCDSNVVMDEEGQPCVFEVFLPVLSYHVLDEECLHDFWFKDHNYKQYTQWLVFNSTAPPTLTEQMKKFIDFIDRVTANRPVEIYVDTAMYDVARMDMLLNETEPWEGKPPSWSYLLKNKMGKRYYSSVMDISSIYYGWSHLTPVERMIVCKRPGGIKGYLRDRKSVV